LKSLKPPIGAGHIASAQGAARGNDCLAALAAATYRWPRRRNGGPIDCLMARMRAADEQAFALILNDRLIPE